MDMVQLFDQRKAKFQAAKLVKALAYFTFKTHALVLAEAGRFLQDLKLLLEDAGLFTEVAEFRSSLELPARTAWSLFRDAGK